MVLELPKIDPSAAEFSRLRGKIWCRRKSAEKKIRLAENPQEKNKIRPPPNFFTADFRQRRKKRNYGV